MRDGYLKEANMDCVKVEGGVEVIPVIKALTDASIPVIGHTGLTPKRVKMLGATKLRVEMPTRLLI